MMCNRHAAWHWVNSHSQNSTALKVIMEHLKAFKSALFFLQYKVKPAQKCIVLKPCNNAHV